MSAGAKSDAPDSAMAMPSARDVARTLAALVVLPFGLLAHLLTGRTGARSYQAYVWLFCVSGGRFNDALSWLISRLRPQRDLGAATGVLGDLSGARGDAALSALERDGYIVFERALPLDVCDRLLRFAATTPAKVRRMDGDAVPAAPRPALFDGSRPEAVRYDYDTADLLDNQDVQQLLADRSLLALAQRYLGCEPIADVLSMWWHTNHHTQPDSEAAQFYHFDLDRLKWLKIFVYLTDVGPENGPHSFVVGSHARDGIPWRLRRKGYVRLSDEEVESTYGAQRCLHIAAPRGSIIVEDTRGLHKGATVRGAARLVLQLQFSNSLFGAAYPKARISTLRSGDFRARLEQMPAVYRQYV